MKIRTLLIPLLLVLHVCTGQQKKTIHDAAGSARIHETTATLDCSNWLGTPSNPSYFDVGQIPITGHTITVEALINRTTPYSGGLLYAGDVVSKHDNPSDVNYLLRPNTAEITTSIGYYRTPDICEIELNKTYHVAMVYDGTTLKFYRNGFLMSQIAATGDLFQNSWRTQIGYYQSEIVNTNFIGYINEVRIWNVARTQAQIAANMNSSLSSPATQTGLVAYYTFDNLLNKQGNAAYNGTLYGAASINQVNPACTLIADSCELKVTNTTVTPVFTAPDTVCVNAPVAITNQTAGASSYYWSFCVAGINTTPTAVNLGNPGGLLSQPVFSDIVTDNGNYYAFVVDFYNSGITRLDFGNSMLNTPVATDMGNPSGALNAQYGKEGIQVIKNEGKWYAIIVGGNPVNGSTPKIVKIEFGTNIANNSPTGTDWGDLGGNLLEPIDLYMFQDNGIWYGFTTNANNNTITRFNFTNSFNNTPTALNMGNPGGLLQYPTGIYTVNDNGNYRIFVTNGQGTFSLIRLDFGNSLLNTPTAVDLGNPGNALNAPRDFTILKLCDEIAGFAVNAGLNDLAKFDFHNDLTSVPSGVSLGNTGNLNFPHSLSKFFRVSNDLYVLITNVSNNTITRLQFSGCTAANIASSAVQNPPVISYNTPGTYSINLSVDEGLPTQNTFCKQVVVVPQPVHTPLQKILSCNLDSIKIGTGLKQVSYLWNNGATTDSIYVKNGGSYWVQSNTPYGCANIDSFTVGAEKITVKTNNDTAICAGKTIQLNTVSTAVSYSWSPANGLSDSTIANPLATPLTNTQYIVTGKGANGCIVKDTVTVSVNPTPVIAKTGDTTICHDKTLQLNVSGGNTYTWQPSSTLSNINIPNPVAAPLSNTTYYITVSNSGNCPSSDSIKVVVKPLPVFAVTPGVTACKGSPSQLTAVGGDIYSWQPADGLNNTNISGPVATPDVSTIYTVKIISSACDDSVSLPTAITILPLPVVKATSSNDVDCSKPVTQLNATGGLYYLWAPAAGLNDSTIAAPLSSPSANVIYVVKGTDLNGCKNYDSVTVLVTHTGDLLVNMPNAFTPNGDGRNDCFGVSRYAGLLQHVQLSVYDRFGVRIFYTTNPLNCWDGRYKGTMLDSGGFAYILQATTFCGPIFKKGIVMLIK